MDPNMALTLMWVASILLEGLKMFLTGFCLVMGAAVALRCMDK